MVRSERDNLVSLSGIKEINTRAYNIFHSCIREKQAEWFDILTYAFFRLYSTMYKVHIDGKFEKVNSNTQKPQLLTTYNSRNLASSEIP